MKGFKYQITVAHFPVYSNSTTKTVINSEFNLDKSFQEVLYRIDNWINEGSGWKIESINGEYVNISMYSPLIGSTYIELPDKLKNPMKGLINTKNKGNTSFLWCHISQLNLVKTYLERITKKIKNMITDLNNICINVICYENGFTYPVYVSDQKFHDSMDLLLITNENKSH